MNDEPKHLALSRSYHFFVFSRECPRACTVPHRRGDDCIEQSKSVSKLGPSVPDTAYYFDFLYLELDGLSQLLSCAAWSWNLHEDIVDLCCSLFVFFLVEEDVW